MFIETGTRFRAEVRGFPIYHYRFVGIDLDDVKHGTGCRYIVLFNEEFQNETRVEAAWFRERKIVIEDDVKKQKNR